MSGRRHTRGRSGSRRRFLSRMGAGGAIVLGIGSAVQNTSAFTSMSSPRTSAVGVAADSDGIVGLINHSPVKKNNREPLLQLTNNGADAVTFTVVLDTCTDGTLFDNLGGSGCSVTFPVATGNVQFVDIDATVTGTIGFSIDVSSAEFALETVGTLESVSGNIKGAVDVQKPVKDQDFTAVPPQGNQGNVFEIKSVDVRDEEFPDDLAEITFEVREMASGTLVAEKTVIPPDPGRYNPSGNPAEIVEPNDGYTIQSGSTYRLTVTGRDTDDNFDTSTVEDTA